MTIFRWFLAFSCVVPLNAIRRPRFNLPSLRSRPKSPAARPTKGGKCVIEKSKNTNEKKKQESPPKKLTTPKSPDPASKSQGSPHMPPPSSEQTPPSSALEATTTSTTPPQSALEVQLASLKEAAEKKMKADIETGLSWYCTSGGGSGKNETLCRDYDSASSDDGKAAAATGPRFECFQSASPREKKRFLFRACLAPDSPIASSKLCTSFRSSLALEVKDTVAGLYKRIGRFLFIELPLLKAAYNFVTVNLARLVGLRRRVAVVRFEGTIAANQGIDVKCVEALEEAFLWKPAAVFLEVNSGGGSPVQSSVIYRRLKQLKQRYFYSHAHPPLTHT
jgi:hypothetical protein